MNLGVEPAKDAQYISINVPVHELIIPDLKNAFPLTYKR